MPVPIFMGGGGYRNVGPLQMPVEDISIDAYLRGISAGHAMPNTATAVARGISDLGRGWREDQTIVRRNELTQAQALRAQAEAEVAPEQVQAEILYKQAMAARAMAEADPARIKIQSELEQARLNDLLQKIRQNEVLYPLQVEAERAKQVGGAMKAKTELNKQRALERQVSQHNWGLQVASESKQAILQSGGDEQEIGAALDDLQKNLPSVVDSSVYKTPDGKGGIRTEAEPLQIMEQLEATVREASANNPALTARARQIATDFHNATVKKIQLYEGKTPARPSDLAAPAAPSPIDISRQRAQARGERIAEKEAQRPKEAPEPPLDPEDWVSSVLEGGEESYRKERTREAQTYKTLNAYLHGPTMSQVEWEQTRANQIVEESKRNRDRDLWISPKDAKAQAALEWKGLGLDPAQEKEVQNYRSNIQNLENNVTEARSLFRSVAQILNDHPEAQLRIGPGQSLGAAVEEWSTQVGLQLSEPQREIMENFRNKLDGLGKAMAALYVIKELGLGVRNFDTPAEQEAYQQLTFGAGKSLKQNLQALSMLSAKLNYFKRTEQMYTVLSSMKRYDFGQIKDILSGYDRNYYPVKVAKLSDGSWRVVGTDTPAPLEYLNDYVFSDEDREQNAPVDSESFFDKTRKR